jgi:hypothetical protein
MAAKADLSLKRERVCFYNALNESVNSHEKDLSLISDPEEREEAEATLTKMRKKMKKAHAAAFAGSDSDSD